ncbi:DNA replication/repair protein RecF [Pontivivens ytuae]|uniref:DNA replication and repair protein RecF n=1 Tax=Pontivivens ytuae TaxID=2789856 RepID=A0A7S9QE35_9RHOB|nr:DNA replication/repair protein RecF [Pontivivens ytuae]QPH55923.1 DNA replication/repair protein RecF [Pontivivens ytuae]
MSHLTSLRLSQFRSHVRAVLEPTPGRIAIYGPNGAGKTNILEAISLLSPGRGLRRAAPAELARAPKRLGWRVRAAVDGHEIETGAEGEQPRTVRIDDKAAPQVALGRILRVLWLIPSMDRLWLDGAAERRRFLDRIALSLEPTHGETVLTYEKAMRERNRLLRDQVRDPSWYAALEAQMATSGETLAATRQRTLDALAEAQEGAATTFPVADLALTDPDGAPFALDDFATRLAEGRPRDLAAGRTLAGPHRADLDARYGAKDIPARLCSTGEQKALLISLILANARAVMQRIGTPPILLLDEVAAHLDPDRRQALYGEIDALGCQAWMTGTDRELFAFRDAPGVILHVTEQDGVSNLEEIRSVK